MADEQEELIAGLLELDTREDCWELLMAIERELAGDIEQAEAERDPLRGRSQAALASFWFKDHSQASSPGIVRRS